MRKVQGNKRRALRWARNIVLGVVGFVAFIVLAAFITFETAWGKEMLRSQIESKVSEMFVGGAKIGGLRGNPFTELTLVDVVINGPDKQKAIAVKDLTIKLPLLPLLSHQLRVDKVIANDLDIHIKQDARGELNLAKLMKPTEEKSTWSIKLPHVEVHRGHVRVERAGAETIDIDNLELYVGAALPYGGPIDAALSLSADWRQKKVPIDVAANIHLDDEVSRVNSLAAQISDIDVMVTNLTVPRSVFAKPFGGSVAIYAPAMTVAALEPAISLPGDLALALVATPDGRLTHATATGVVVPGGRFHLLANADVQAKLVQGVLSADGLDLRKLTRGKLDGHGGAIVAFDVDGNDDAELPTVSAMITAWGQAGKAPPTHAVIAIESRGERLHAAVGASSDTGLRATIDAAIHKRGEHITLERGLLVASTPDAKRATQGIAPFRGALRANIAASGAIAPKPNLALRGHADGKRLRMQDLAIDSFRFKVDAKNVPSNPVGSARLEVANLSKGDIELGKLTLAAGNRPDGQLQVSLRSQPKQSPWLFDFDALVAMEDNVVVKIQRHLVRAAGATEWRGNSGTLVVTPQEIALTDFVSRSGNGHVTANAAFIRAGKNQGDLFAHFDVALEMTNIQKAYRGEVEAHVDVERQNGRMNGRVLAKVAGLALDPRSPMLLDGNVELVAKADQLLANLSLSTAKAGSARIAVDVDAPKDVANAAAWSTLGRSSIRNAQLSFDKLDLAQLAVVVGAGKHGIKGIVDGDVKLDAKGAGGIIHLRDVQLKQTKDLGSIFADLTLTEERPNQLKTSVTARLEPLPEAIAAKDVTKDGAARFLAEARFEIPERMFEIAAWQRLGAKAFRGGSLRAERLGFQPGTLERLGIISDLRGELAIGAEIEAGMKVARFSVNLHDLRGGQFAKPVAINVAGVLDERSSRVAMTVHAEGVTLLKLDGLVPVSLADLRADPQAAKLAPVIGTASITRVPAKTLMGVLGTSQITGGVLDGSVKFGGTVGKPTVAALLKAYDVTVPPESGEPTQGIKLLTLDAYWDGERGQVEIDADQTKGGKLRIRAAGSPAELAAATASIDASKVDIAPLVAFMPGPAGGLGGRLDAKFSLKGANPATADLAGSMHITNGRIPIAPAVGTLFKGDLKIDIRNRVIDLRLTGKLGRGDLRLVASAPLEGATPKSGKLKLTVSKVQLIGTTQPIITGSVDADVARVDEVWRANVKVVGLTVKVPPEKGAKLSPVGTPADLVYGGAKIHHGKNKGRDVPQGIVKDTTGPADLKAPSQVAGPVAKRRPPGAPVADARITIRNVFVESNEIRGLLGGNLRVSVGETKEVGIIGQIMLTRGVLNLFNRRYQVDKANLHFDGSPDPVLDVRIMRDFPEVTTITEVRGRMSKPKLVLSSQPAQYTQAELLGFLLGGEPGGDPENASSAGSRVASAGASFLGNKVGGYVKKALPVDIDVLRYEASSSTSSAAVTVGTWITDSLFLAYRRHLDARPDENSGEGELEYWIRRRLVLEAVAGDRGVNGLDLLWRRRW